MMPSCIWRCMKAAYGMPLSGKSIGASTVGSAAIPMFTSKLSQQEQDAGTGILPTIMPAFSWPSWARPTPIKSAHSRFPTAIPSSTIPRARCCWFATDVAASST